MYQKIYNANSINNIYNEENNTIFWIIIDHQCKILLYSPKVLKGTKINFQLLRFPPVLQVSTKNIFGTSK